MRISPQRTLSILPLLVALMVPTVSAQDPRVRVEIVGLDDELRRNAESVMSIVSAARGGRISEARIEQLYYRAIEEIELALEPFGYYRPGIVSRLDTGTLTWVASYEVDPGPALLLSRVDVQLAGEGADDEELRQAVADFPLAPGDTLRHGLYDRGKLDIAGLVAERGYLDAVIDTAQIRIDLEEYTAEIVLHLTTGPRYLFGPVTFNQDVVYLDRLEGYVTFQPGDTFELSRLLELQRGLNSSAFFSQVEVLPIREEARGRSVPIQVNALPRRRQRYELGGGYGTDTGFRGTVEANFRRLNRKGHNATVRLEISQIRRNIAGQYRFPPAYPHTATYALTINAGDISPTWSRTLQLAFGTNRSQLRGPLHEVLSLSYDLQDFTIADVDGTSNLLMLGTSHSWTNADDNLLPLSGISLQLVARASHDAVASSATFLRLVARGKAIKGIGRRFRVIGRVDAGRLFTSQFDQLPPTIRFVTGGDRTVRGYGFETLGPRNSEGQVVGGDVMLAASTEFDFAITEKWRAAAFFDAGNALAAGGEFRLQRGAGVGARWMTAVGMLRVDFAYGFDEPGRGFRLHLTFGPDL